MESGGRLCSRFVREQQDCSVGRGTLNGAPLVQETRRTRAERLVEG